MVNFWKNKKIIAYIALAHHTRFITPVMDKLQHLGAKVKYIVGQAERSQEITAIELGLNYSHIFDFISEQDYPDIQMNYSRLKKTFSNSLKSNYLLGTLPITVTDKTLYAVAAEFIGVRNLLRTEKPTLCFALHELNRWGKIFSFWAKKENIPFVTLQEGLTYDNDFTYTGHAQYSMLNLVWGERVKKKMISYDAPESKIIPVGNTHLSNEIKYQKKNNIRKKKREEYHLSNRLMILLIFSPNLPNPDLLKPLLKTISKSNIHSLFIKFHPGCKKLQIDKWVGSFEDPHKKNCHFIHGQENSYNLISMADLCVLGQASTIGLESIAFGKPLVKLDFAYHKNSPYSFVDQGVAVKMDAKELSQALISQADFSKLIDGKKVESYLENELTGTKDSIDNICGVLKKVIQAQMTIDTPLEQKSKAVDKIWSIVLPVIEDYDILLNQLESISLNSNHQGDYEIILLEPIRPCEKISMLLDSLKGDIQRIPVNGSIMSSDAMNTAGQIAKGKRLIFLEDGLAPLDAWLDHLNTAFSTHGNNKSFGACISSQNGQVAHAGIVLDHNNSPVSAYQHLRLDFPGILKERSFQMMDGFICLNRELFFKTGGFTSHAGKFKFLDLCLKLQIVSNDPNAAIYLPMLKLIYLKDPNKRSDYDGAIYFYGRWNHLLWESETRLHKADKITPEELAQARMAAAR